MYERFYGLQRQPFAVTPDPSLFYMSRVHREALATIVYGIETRKGFVVCTGEVGTGKTTIVRAIFDQAASESFEIVYSFAPQISPLQMATYICRELDEDDPSSVFAALPRLQWKLLEIFESGRTVVLMIDEAQLLPPETLEFLRLLSNFETDREKLIQTVLVGQPELDESIEYIEHRLLASGSGDLTQILSPGAAWRIAEAADGIPRAINILADNVLIAGLGAGQRPVGDRLADNAIRDFIDKSGAASPVRRQSRLRRWRGRQLARSRRRDTAFGATFGLAR
jgi:general secretion pathway protein A